MGMILFLVGRSAVVRLELNARAETNLQETGFELTSSQLTPGSRMKKHWV